MGLTYTQGGILGASISAGTIVIICITLFVWRTNLPFTFSRRNPPCTDLEMQKLDAEVQYRVNNLNRNSMLSSKSIAGEYTQYGELFVPPDKRCMDMALDIMTRMLMVTGLPGKASPIAAPASRPVSQAAERSYAMGSAMESGGAPRLSVNLGSRTSLCSAMFPALENVPALAGAELQISSNALRDERRAIEDMRAATAMLRAA